MGQILTSLRLTNFLSFGLNSKCVELTPLNVLIGPNGVGKSNFIEAIELLHALPIDLRGAVRMGGSPLDWIWRGSGTSSSAGIEAMLAPVSGKSKLRYGIEFAENGQRLEVVNEFLEDAEKTSSRAKDVRFYYRYLHGHPKILKRVAANTGGNNGARAGGLSRESIDPEQSILAQRKGEEAYPELTAVGKRFEAIQLFREWSFGRSAVLRSPQAANLPTDVLLPQLANLGLVLNDLEHQPTWNRFNALMTKFLPRFTRISTKISGGSVQIYLHEDGLKAPIPATRLSDGTLRFIALLAILLHPERASLICIEEPELGLHPDALGILAELIAEASDRTQLIVTTHSDVFVSELTEHAESILVCDFLENGTELLRLESSKLTFWLEQYRLGEIWRIGKLGGNLW